MKVVFNGNIWWVIMLAWFCGIQAAIADSFDVLTPRFSGTAQPLHAVAFANGAYIAVGDGGTILYSQDSVTWVPQMSGTTNRLNSIKYGTNGFVAVGDAGTILQSMDGITWVQRNSPVSNKLSAITYGIGRYVAVGSSGIIVTSTNGVNWSSISTGAPYNFNGVDFTWFNAAFPNAIYVLVGDSGTIMTSPDGLAWTVRFSGAFARLNAVSIHCQNFNTYNMVAAGDTGVLDTSSDGISWTVVTSGTSSNLLAIANDGMSSAPARFGAVGQGGVFVTGSGSSYQAQINNASMDLDGLAYAHGNFLAVGGLGTIEAAISWQPENSAAGFSLTTITYGAGTFIAVGGTSVIQSTNGTDWTVVHTGGEPEGSLASVAYGSNGYVAVGGNGTILTSSNGVNWSSQLIGPSFPAFSAVSYGNGLYVAIGVVFISNPPFTFYRWPIAYSSTDGVNWTNSFTFTNYDEPFYGLASANNVFVAVGYGGQIATSPDGIAWTARNSGLSQNLNAVAYGNGLFVAVGNGGVTVSGDGTNWTPIGAAAFIATSLTYGGDGFVGFYGGPPIPSFVTSPDGTNWTLRGYDGPVGGVAFGNGAYVVVGNGISRSISTNTHAIPLLSGQLVNRGFKLSATAQPNYSYRIQSCTNLLLTNWSTLFTFASTQAVTTVTDSIPAGALQNFYRIVSP